MCPTGATCLPTDCCLSDLPSYKNPTNHVGLVQGGRSSSFNRITCSRNDIAKKCSLGVKQQSITYSPTLAILLSRGILYSKTKQHKGTMDIIGNFREHPEMKFDNDNNYKTKDIHKSVY